MYEWGMKHPIDQAQDKAAYEAHVSNIGQALKKLYKEVLVQNHIEIEHMCPGEVHEDDVEQMMQMYENALEQEKYKSSALKAATEKREQCWRNWTFAAWRTSHVID